MHNHETTMVYLPADLARSIADLADAEGVSFNETLRRAIRARAIHVREADEWAAARLDQLEAERRPEVVQR